MATKMMEHIGLPEKLNLQGNLDAAWKLFRQTFEIYLVATDLVKASEEQKIALLLHAAGTQAVELFNSFVLTEEEKKIYNKVIEKFEEYCSPRKNELFERYVFRCRIQHEGEAVEKFCADLKILAQTCNFETLKDSMIRDQLVWGLFDKKVKERLLRAKDLTLDEALNMVQAAEVTQARMAIFNNGGKSEIKTNVEQIDFITRPKKTYQDKDSKYETKSMERERQKQKNKCSNCGSQHEYGNCIARGKRCFKCNRNGHFAYYCRSYDNNDRYADRKYERTRINVIKDDMENLNDVMQEFRLDMVKTSRPIGGKEKWTLQLKVQVNNLITFKLDTGAETNVLPERVYNKIKPKIEIKPGNIKLTGYNGGIIETLGYIITTIEVKGQIYPIKFVIARDSSQPSILGSDACERLGLVKRVYKLNLEEQSTGCENLLKNYENLFNGLGCVKQKHNIRLKSNAIPVVQAPRRIAFAIRDKLKIELDRLINMGIIEKVEEPTDWVSSMVIKGKKNGDLRICLDPRDLNRNIRREHFQIPTKDEIMAELSGAKYFTKLDVKCGFHQIPLDRRSARLCTFNTPFGRHCFLRLPFGLTSAPEVFQRMMNNVFDGLMGVKVYIDDVLIWGETREEHNQRLSKALQRIGEAGLTLNREKCEFAIQELTFLGEEITSRGVKPDKNKIEAIINMEPPKSKEEVRRLLGLIGYLGKFIPHLSQKTAALRSLIKEKMEWVWEHEHIKEFKDIKDMLTSPPILEFYDPRRRCKISTDSSSYGLGAVLLQLHGESWRPVSYAARSLTSTEMRYAQVEKEALGLVYGCERFHDFVYGRHVLLETDHRPLVAMSKKSMAEIPPRVQRLFLRLLAYDYELMFTPGRKLIVADALSRLVDKRPGTDIKYEEELQVHVDMIMGTAPIGDNLLQRIKEETGKDKTLQEVNKQLGRKGRFHGLAAAFINEQNCITEQEGILLREAQVIIPKTMQPEILDKIHEGHMGIEKCKNRARATVFWPGIGRDIEAKIKKCETCQTMQYSKPREQLLQYEIVQQPWQQVGMDLFDHRGESHMVIMDYYSNYPIVAKLRDMSAGSVINCIKTIFSMFGIPYLVITDNGPQFASREFREFARHYNFSHRTSSPYYPQSNGLAEKAVQIAKRIMGKCNRDRSDIHLGFLAYRTTSTGQGASPGELLFGRKLRSTLPGINMEKTEVSPHKLKQKYYYDRYARKDQELEKNDVVRIQDKHTGRWPQKARVVEQIAPRSYTVQTEEGKIVRRNSTHLRKTLEPYIRESTEVVEPDSERDSKVKEQTAAAEEPAMELRRSQRVRRAPDRLDL